MGNKVTTTKNGFRVEDITFKNPRKQSAIIEELGIDNVDDSSKDVDVPVSLTPEQVKSFLSAKRDSAKNLQEIKLYIQVIRWIDELFSLKKEVIQLREKISVYSSSTSTDDDENAIF